MALIFGLTASIRRRCASATSVADTCRLPISSASPVASHLWSSFSSTAPPGVSRVGRAAPAVRRNPADLTGRPWPARPLPFRRMPRPPGQAAEGVRGVRSKSARREGESYGRRGPAPADVPTAQLARGRVPVSAGREPGGRPRWRTLAGAGQVGEFHGPSRGRARCGSGPRTAARRCPRGAVGRVEGGAGRREARSSGCRYRPRRRVPPVCRIGMCVGIGLRTQWSREIPNAARKRANCTVTAMGWKSTSGKS